MKATAELKLRSDFVWSASTGGLLVPTSMGATVRAFTVIEKGPMLDEVIPSVTVMVMSPWIPISVLPGTPVNSPVTRSKLAQLGLLLIENVTLMSGVIEGAKW